MGSNMGKIGGRKSRDTLPARIHVETAPRDKTPINKTVNDKTQTTKHVPT